ncbi:MAG: hypothetical protein ACKO5K_06870, partial [Armatimonadota bacterium]
GSVSVLNFHYARPAAVALNRDLGCVIADDETGFLGIEPAPYRAEAWRFLLAGGGVFSHLDYGFTVDHPAGDADLPTGTPGSGGPLLRRQLGWMHRFLEEAAIWDLHPVPLEAVGDAEASSAAAADGDRAVGWCAPGAPPLVLDRSAGTWRIDWYDPATGVHIGQGSIVHPGGAMRLDPPEAGVEAVFRVERRRGHGDT